MNITHCENCGGYTPEGFALCPPCMRESGANESAISAAARILEVINIISIGDTKKSQRVAIKSILEVAEKEGLEL